MCGGGGVQPALMHGLPYPYSPHLPALSRICGLRQCAAQQNKQLLVHACAVLVSRLGPPLVDVDVLVLGSTCMRVCVHGCIMPRSEPCHQIGCVRLTRALPRSYCRLCQDPTALPRSY